MTTRITALLLSLLLAVTATRADALRWAPSPEVPAWNATATNWLDIGDATVVWQPGAEALFDAPATDPVTLDEDAAASSLTFTADGHTLTGTGTLTVATLTAAPGTANRIDPPLRATASLTKTGTGAITLGHPNTTLTTPVTVSEGTLALQGVTLPNTVSVAQPATLAVLPPATNGLTGFFYMNGLDVRAFTTLDTLESYFSRLTPALAASSSVAGDVFDFGANGANFPYPFNPEGYRTNDFQIVWRGAITVPESTWYAFRITHDDGMFLAIDRTMIIRSTMYTTTESQMVYLDAGPHDMFLGYYQGGGGRTLRVAVKQLYGNGDFFPLPNAWLTPYTSVTALIGGGQAALAAGGAALNVAQKSPSAFGGALSGAADALFSKTDANDLTLTAGAGFPNAFEGNVGVRRGTLALTAPERIGDASTVSLAPESALRLASAETIGALDGSGTVIFGGGSAVSVHAFSGDIDSGISTNKTYTHLLDFPATNTPATVNGVTFTAADMNGSANGHSWSTVGPAFRSLVNGPLNDGISRLFEDFVYDPLDYTITLADLTPGKTYEARLYFRSYSSNPSPTSTRKVTFAFTAGNAFAGSTEHVIDSTARSFVRCRYTADDTGTLAIRVLSHHFTDTCHLYGLSNEDAAAEPSEPDTTATPSIAAFTTDADSGISASKAYTHLLDFPANGNPAEINGVVFTAAAMNGTANGYGWSTVNPPSSAWNDNQGIGTDTAREGVDRMLWDFYYNSTDFTMTLTGLSPGQTYETRIYFRAFGSTVVNSSRDVTFTFIAGATGFDPIEHDLDTITRSIVRCRYTADASGTLSIRVFSPNSGSTCHLYALSNEIIPDTAPALILDTPPTREARHTGAIAGPGALTKRGLGIQRLGGPVLIPAPLDVQAGILTLDPGATIPSGVVVQTGATLTAPNGGVRLGGLEGGGTFRLDGLPPNPVTNLIRTVFFTNDVSSEISSDKVYTHLLDFGNRTPTAVINGIAFTRVTTAAGSVGSYGWSNFPPTSHNGSDLSGYANIPADSGIFDLLYDMDYGHSFPGAATMRLIGLTPGKRYEVRLYNRSWAKNLDANRDQIITFDPDGNGPISETITINPDRMLPNYLGYRYTAQSSELAITVQSVYTNQTYHLYGLTNEEIADADYVPASLHLTRNCEFAGTVTGAGDWEKRGPATLTLTGANDATGLLTVHEGTLAISGDRAYAGSVHVVSNAWLRAGAATEPDTLAIGGDLTFAPGTILPWRHTATAADLYAVAGTVTFPTNGVLRLIPSPAGLAAPARRPLIVSQFPINGPDDLTGWVIEGAKNASLRYSADRTEIHFACQRGTMLLLQ